MKSLQAGRGCIYVGSDGLFDTSLDDIQCEALVATTKAVREGILVPSITVVPELSAAIMAVRYVGKVERAGRLQKRITEHLKRYDKKSANTVKAKWIESRIRAGAPPVFRSFQDVNYKHLPEDIDPGDFLSTLERFWIAWFLAHGAKLTNGTKGGDGLDSATARQIWLQVRDKLGPEGMKARARKAMAALGSSGLSARAKAIADNLGVEGLRARARSAMESMGVEGLSERAHAISQSLGPDGRRDRMAKTNKALGPGGRSKRTRKGNETLGPEGRSGRVAVMNANLGSEGRSARARTREQNMGVEGRRKRALSGVETLGPDGLSARARKVAHTLGIDGLRARAKVMNERLGTEGRSARASKRQENMGEESRKAWSRGILEKLGEEGLSARAQKINETLGEEGRKARAQKGAQAISKEQRAEMMRKRVETQRIRSGRTLPVGIYLIRAKGRPIRYMARTPKTEFGYLKQIGYYTSPQEAIAALEEYRRQHPPTPGQNPNIGSKSNSVG